MGLLDQYAKFRDYIAANTPRSTRPVAKPGDVMREGLLNPNKFNAPAANRFKDSVFGLLGGIPGADAPVGFTQGADYFNRGEPVAGAVSVASGVLPFIPPTAAGLFTLAKVADRIGAPLPTGPARKQAGAIVYHGSPHKFDKFDMSKIGTGEGAQAYGHGLYFAESPAVAGNYRNVLSDTLEVKGSAQPLEKRAAQMALTFGDNTTEGALQWLSKFEGKGANHVSPAMTPELVRQVKQKFQDGTFSQGGALYKVDLPDDAIAKMLDWDKPLSEQAELVKMVQEVRPGYYSGGLPNASAPIGGSDAYLSLVETLGKQGATDFLKAKGYPGIRYLDGSSRNAGQGTSNFVLFDDQLPRILEINGQPTGLLSYADEAARKPKKAK